MTKIQSYLFPVISRRKNLAIRKFLVMLLIAVSAPFIASANDPEEYDEILVTLTVKKLGTVEMPAVIMGTTLFLPVKDLFDFLKIKNEQTYSLDSIEGYFITPQITYLVDNIHGRIEFNGKIFELRPLDLIKTETNLYLRIDYFNKIFGLECVFNFRSLSVQLITSVDLPAVRELQQALMRKNVTQVRGEKKADTIISRQRPGFALGTADWSLLSTQEQAGPVNTRIDLGLGAMIAGGEANAYLNYTKGPQFNRNRQFYYWRYVDNDNPVVKQVTLGKIATRSISTITAPIAGFQVSNTPTTYRRSFGTYTLSNTTEPGWIVELYENNVLINYMTADASGFYSFKVPILYGNSVVKLKFYGPLGEERSLEQYITIPFNFVPKGEFEYNLTGGLIDEEVKGQFSRGSFNYGLSNHFTIGGGSEYLNLLGQKQFIPFVTTSLRVGTNLLFSGEHAKGVRTKGIISWRLPSNVQFDLDYAKYVPGQTAIRYNYLEEKRAVVSLPIRGRKFTAFTRLSYNELTLPKQKMHTAEAMVSAIMYGISTNLTTFALFNGTSKPFYSSNLAFNFRLPKGFRVAPQVQYEFKQKNISLFKCEVEKAVSYRGYFNMTYENFNASQNQYLSLGFRYNFSFAQTAFTVRRGNKMTITSQSARGSVLYDDKAKRLYANNQSGLTRGSLLLAPFLDINCNGVRDAGEPKCTGLQVRVNGGRTVYLSKDSTIMVTGLEAYERYLIEFNRDKLDNISWQLKQATYAVTAEPNYVQKIEVPVAVVGEVSGQVDFSDAKGTKGIGRITVNIFDEKANLVAHTVSEPDGYFSYIGLAPGKYIAAIDLTQLKKVNMEVEPVTHVFEIKAGKEGDMIENIKFILSVKK